MAHRLLTNFTQIRQQKAVMNDQQRKQEEFNKAKRQFIQAAAQGHAQVLDRFGNPVSKGDRVFFSPRSVLDTLWEVEAVGPNMDPHAPPGSMVMVIKAQMPLFLGANAPSTNLCVIMKPDPAAGAGQDQEKESGHGTDNPEGTSVVDSLPSAETGNDQGPPPDGSTSSGVPDASDPLPVPLGGPDGPII